MEHLPLMAKSFEYFHLAKMPFNRTTNVKTLSKVHTVHEFYGSLDTRVYLHRQIVEGIKQIL